MNMHTAPLAEHIEDFLATHDPAYGYTIDMEGWDSQKAAQQTIEHMLREKSTWIEQALLPLAELKPELKEQVDFWLSVVDDIGELDTPAIVGEITYLDTNETLTFTDSEAYLSELNNALNVRGINGWKHTTHTTDVDTRYQVACLTYGAFGEEVDKAAFYRLYEQHGADMGSWGDSQQWIVQEDINYYVPDEPPVPSTEDIQMAHWQIDSLVAKTSPQEFLDNVLNSHSRDLLLYSAAQEVINKNLPDFFPTKFRQGFFDNMPLNEMRQWLEFGEFRKGQLLAFKPSDLNRNKPSLITYQKVLYLQAIDELHKHIEAMSQNDLIALKIDMHNYEISIPKDPMQAVQENGEALKDISAQTPEICLAAVKKHGWALEYVKEQTPEICLAAGQLPPAQEQSYDLQIPVSDKLTARVSIKVKLEEAAHRSNKGRSSTNLTPTKEVTVGR